MRKLLLALSVATLSVSTGVSSASEFNDGTIVVSDNWCNPFNDGNCNKCNSGRFITRATCTASYCDNVSFQCSMPGTFGGAQMSLSGPQFIVNDADSTKNYGWISSADGFTATNARCPAGFAMVGAFSVGSYSGSWRTVCQQVVRIGGWGATNFVLQQAGTISEEAPNTSATGGKWLSGPTCSGTNCDNMKYWFTDPI